VSAEQFGRRGLFHGPADHIAGRPVGGGINRSLTAKPDTALALLSAAHAAEAIGARPIGVLEREHDSTIGATGAEATG
jgi:hypothetical protein